VPYRDDGSDVPSYVHGAKRRRQWSHIWNAEYRSQKDKGKSDKEAEQIAFASANGVAGTGKVYASLLAKAVAEDARAFADAVIAAIEKDFESLPVNIRGSLESARLSGIGQGMVQTDIGNAALLSTVNAAAQEYATERSAEMIGMRRDLEGNLIENPDARWAISDTTRDRIREIVRKAFTEQTDLADIADAIEQALAAEAEGAGIFSPERARLIAETEVANAQTGGNYAVWEKSNVVLSTRWLTSEDENVCAVCDGNDNQVRAIGVKFPSGDLYPGAHPRCRCVLAVEDTATTVQ